MRKFSLLALFTLFILGAKAQTANFVEQPTADKYRVVTNRFWSNWYITAGGAADVMFSNYDSELDFGKRINPDFYFGVGKWFTPGFGAMIQVQGLRAKGVIDKAHFDKHYTTNRLPDGTPEYLDGTTDFAKQTVKYSTFNILLSANLSNLLGGYIDGGRKSNWILNGGLSVIHHWDVENSSDNEFGGLAELKYSYNFIPALSVDLKANCLFARTNFDGVISGKKVDFIAGVGLGLTYYINKRTWDRCANCCECDEIDRLNQEINQLRNRKPQYSQNTKTAEFYIFYPNNYSGRNDAPIVSAADVNTIDYVVNGNFTQKRFVDTNAAEKAMGNDAKMAKLATSDVKTTKASQSGNGRGYEMGKTPISMSTDARSMADFEKANGYVAAPIYAEKDYQTKTSKTNKWNYRIDDATKGQVLLDNANYTDAQSYQLNAHAGLPTLQSKLNINADTQLFSFADVYAAIEGNSGNIAQYANPQAVAAFQRIMNSGRVKRIIITGVATSQDNQTINVDVTRNATLANNRANSAADWLRGSGKFRGVEFVVNAGTDTFGTVNSASINDLMAKLNRAAKVQIVYTDERQVNN